MSKVIILCKSFQHCWKSSGEQFIREVDSATDVGEDTHLEVKAFMFLVPTVLLLFCDHLRDV